MHGDGDNDVLTYYFCLHSLGLQKKNVSKENGVMGPATRKAGGAGVAFVCPKCDVGTCTARTLALQGDT